MHKADKIIGPVLALDLGRKRVGVAVSDNLLISITQLNPLRRSNWKQLLRDVAELAQRFDAQTMVIGLPLMMNGTRGSAALETEMTARKFARSLRVPVYLQDERLTSAAAEERLKADGYNRGAVADRVDSQSAAIILADFLTPGQARILLESSID